MKLYLLNGTYYEKQADVPKRQGKFEAVEFPFSASPKADFVAWINDRGNEAVVEQAESELLPVDRHVKQLEERAKAAPPPPASRVPKTVDGVLEWVFDGASNADIENLFTALGTRFHEMRRAVS